jgi:hypothetical protein
MDDIPRRDPRHQRPALRQRPHPPGAPGRVHPDRIWVRFQRLSGHTCYYVCADDNHGTRIMLKAEAEGVSTGCLRGPWYNPVTYHNIVATKGRKDTGDGWSYVDSPFMRSVILVKGWISPVVMSSAEL